MKHGFFTDEELQSLLARSRQEQPEHHWVFVNNMPMLCLPKGYLKIDDTKKIDWYAQENMYTRHNGAIFEFSFKINEKKFKILLFPEDKNYDTVIQAIANTTRGPLGKFHEQRATMFLTCLDKDDLPNKIGEEMNPYVLALKFESSSGMALITNDLFRGLR